jgi:hypothetical protein
MLAISSFVSGLVWFNTTSAQFNQGMEHIQSTLLHSQRYVFVGAEEYDIVLCLSLLCNNHDGTEM